MRRRLFVLGPVVLAVAALGCAGEAAPDAIEEPAEGAEDALTQSQLPGVAAIAFEYVPGTRGDFDGLREVIRGPTIGLASKVTKVMRAIKTRRPSDPIPLCHPGSPRTSMTFYDGKGNEIAHGSYMCLIGQVDVAGGRPIPIIVRSSAIAEVREMPLVPADVLWGINEIDITRRGANAAEVKVRDDAGIAKALGAIESDKIDPNHSGTRCLPSHTLRFKRKDKEVASLSYKCNATGPLPEKVTSMFFADHPDDPEGEPLLRGGVDLDPRVVETLLPARR